MLYVKTPVLNPVWFYTSAILATSSMHFVQNLALNCQSLSMWQLFSTLSLMKNSITILPHEWVFTYIPGQLIISREWPIVTPPWANKKLTSPYKTHHFSTTPPSSRISCLSVLYHALTSWSWWSTIPSFLITV